MSRSLPATRFSLTATLVLLLSLLPIAFAQSSTTTSTPSTTTTTASIYPGTSSWAYYGCYNETTLYNNTNGQRALNGGVMEALDIMTVPLCLGFCQTNGYAFAGVEYTRECYCAPYLSALSNHLPDSRCNLPCEGNSSQLCGGSLTLSVYQAKSSTKGAAIKGPGETPKVGSILALGIALGVALFCI